MQGDPFQDLVCQSEDQSPMQAVLARERLSLPALGQEPAAECAPAAHACMTCKSRACHTSLTKLHEGK